MDELVSEALDIFCRICLQKQTLLICTLVIRYMIEICHLAHPAQEAECDTQEEHTDHHLHTQHRIAEPMVMASSHS